MPITITPDMITATIMNTTMTTITIITTLERRLVATAAAYIVYSVIPILAGYAAVCRICVRTRWHSFVGFLYFRYQVRNARPS